LEGVAQKYTDPLKNLKNSKMKTIFIQFLIILFSSNLGAQKNGCYNYYSFGEFLKFNTENPIKFRKTFYKIIRYPAKAREKEIECTVKILFINHSEFDQEILFLGCKNEILIKEVKKVFELTNSVHLVKSNIKYITEFFVDFDLEPANLNNNSSSGIHDFDIFKVFSHRSSIQR
jgi:hypothetical protein